MSAFSFLGALGSLQDIGSSNDSDADNAASCEEAVPTSILYLALLGPSIFLSVILAFTTKRENKYMECCNGRPGLLYAQDVLARSNRFSYAAAFGSIAFLCYNVVFNAQGAFTLDDPPIYVKVFVKLLSMIIYGIDYYPLFASLAVNNIPGYMVGSLFAVGLMLIRFFNTFYCDELDMQDVGILILRGLPELSCLMYLSISLPIRLIIRIRRRNIENHRDYDEFIMTSYCGIHTSAIFKKPEPPPPEPEGMKNKIKAFILSIPSRFFYNKIPNFRYSGRVVSVMLVAFIVMYMATVELSVAVISLLNLVEQYVFWGYGEFETMDPADPAYDGKIFLDFIWYIVNAMRICFAVSISLAFFCNIITILHSLCTYRSVLLALYKGDNAHLSPKESCSNAHLVVGSMRYAGYQVAYIAWGFALQTLVLFLIAFVLAGAITLIKWQILDAWFLTQFNNLWPVLLTTLFVTIGQTLMAKFFFLQDGLYLRLENRRLFFIVVYFLFFYNIFLGFISCLLRIIKAIVIGTIFMSRIDHSTLPLKFQDKDPGFDAYCGFMHVEAAHTHPVAVTFLRILKSNVILAQETGNIHDEDGQRKHTKVGGQGNKHTFVKMMSGNNISRRSRFIRSKWHLAYTLIRNPILLLKRKQNAFKALEMYDTYTSEYNKVPPMNTAAIDNSKSEVKKIPLEDITSDKPEPEETTKKPNGNGKVYPTFNGMDNIDIDFKPEAKKVPLELEDVTSRKSARDETTDL